MPDDRGVRRIIEGLPNLVWGGIGKEVIKDDLATDDLTIVPVMRVCLAYIGERFSKVYLAGTSCVAFYIGWRADSLWSGMGGAVYQFPEEREPGLVNLFRAIGRDFQLVKRSTPQLLWESAVESIDAGRPVMCNEWKPVAHRGHCGVIAGYDEEKKEFLGRSYDTKPQKGYVSLKPQNLNYILVIKEKTRDKLSSHEAALGALRCAVCMSRVGIREGEEIGVYGLLAYERQAKMILEGMNPTIDGYNLLEHWLFWRLEILYHCRCYATEYLKEIASQFSPTSRNHIKVARKSFEELLKQFDKNIRIIYGPEAIKSDTNLLWRDNNKEYPIRKLFSTVEGRHRFADLLLRIQDIEAKAISEIEKSIEKAS
jgi:hypothetical protein